MKALVVGIVAGISILVIAYAITQLAPVRGNKSLAPPTATPISSPVPARTP